MGWSKIQLNLAVGESLNRCMKKKALVVFYVITEVVELSASISFSSFLILITYLSDPEYQLFDKKHLFEALLGELNSYSRISKNANLLSQIHLFIIIIIIKKEVLQSSESVHLVTKSHYLINRLHQNDREGRI